MQKFLYEILVPTNVNNHNPARLRHHRRWDDYVRKLSGGLTILRPATGQWVHQDKLFVERVIPVRIYCTEDDIKKIIKFTLGHYQQIAVMAYKISSEVYIEYA